MNHTPESSIEAYLLAKGYGPNEAARQAIQTAKAIEAIQARAMGRPPSDHAIKPSQSQADKATPGAP